MENIRPEASPYQITGFFDAEELQGRRLMLSYLEKELIGPVGGVREVLEGEGGHKRYTMGVLFPVAALQDDNIGDEEEEGSGSSGSDDLSDDPVTLSGQWMPSSMGVSFYFLGDPELEVSVYGSKYLKSKGRQSEWTRVPLADKENPQTITISPGGSLKAEVPVLEGMGKVVGHWRKLGSGYLVTVTLVNSNEQTGKDTNGEDCICQAGFGCRVVAGQIQEYPSVKVNTSDEEEEELQLLYRKNRVFGVGHGCSIEWEQFKGVPVVVRTQVMPVAFVAAMTHDLDESPEILRVSRLAGAEQDKSIIIKELKLFTGLYETWIGKLESGNADIVQRLTGAKQRILSRLSDSLRRMNEGIACLEMNEKAWKAFRLANLAMLIQMRHGKDDLAGKGKVRGSAVQFTGDYFGLDYKWRPFQLAFQLLTIEPMTNPNSDFREVVDLIWFPTGGGKTEAYLALAAFEIFYRRMSHGEQGGGTAVITRYTLRLLTAQQFQRASRLITACEYLRRQNSGELGSTPITIGFWAGGETSPNDYAKAIEALSEIKEARYPAQKNRFQIDCCPWCGTELLPTDNSADRADFGFECENQSFRVFCTDTKCQFHNSIPVLVVDEDLYKYPPTFLIATVDKFARTPWVEGAGNFFGADGCLPPALVIQDELHLLSGPLGTTVALYESAFDGLMSFHGGKPKIVASTATIRSAGAQVESLFARKVMIFPSPGLTADDSFFAKTDKTRNGRLYVGVMSSNHRATTSVVRTAASLLQSVQEADLTEAERDAYWTLVMYHLSLRELGKTVSFSRDDIPARIKIIAKADDLARKVYDDDVMELTSNLSAAEIPESLRRIEKKYNDPDAVSVVACTNMLSVGVDVPRLGLMMINGQPKTTSEYIQASSRVGRGKVPGIVITHYSSSKPRDRSHYESFNSYHASLYRFVEPASVTPFSLPSRNRALHAALVILIRHGAGLKSNTSIEGFDATNVHIVRAVNILLEQARVKDPQEFENTKTHIQRLIGELEEMIRRARKDNYQFFYSGAAKQIRALLKDFTSKKEGWPTLHSMRSVDPDCKIMVIGEKN